MVGLTKDRGGVANDRHLQPHHDSDEECNQRRFFRKFLAIFYQQSGMVTAEFAVILMAVSVVISMVLFAATVGVSYVQTQDSARQAARLIARGESQSKAVGQAQDTLPGAQIKVSYSSDSVSVHVSRSVTLPVAKIALGGVTVSSTAHASREYDSASTQR